MRTPEEISKLKQTENVYRFRTWCILEGVVPTEMLEIEAKRACRAFYADHLGVLDVPKSVFMGLISSLYPKVAVEGVQEVMVAF